MPGISVLAAVLPFTWLLMTQQDAPETKSNCRVPTRFVELAGLPEASGVAASRRTPGVFWAHNDSGDPVILAVDARGTVQGRVRVTGASVTDWEDIAVGPCRQGSCIYIADIGDNDGSRDHVTLYRTPEPTPADGATAFAEVFNASYPDGPHDAEALFVTGEGDVYIITKGDPGPVALYRFPRTLAAGQTLALERVGEPLAAEDVDAKDRPTAAAVSPDGRWVAVRTTRWIAFYRTSDLTSGRWREASRTNLSGLHEPRGEGLTFSGSDAIVLVGESAGRLRGAGSFAMIPCAIK